MFLETNAVYSNVNYTLRYVIQIWLMYYVKNERIKINNIDSIKHSTRHLLFDNEKIFFYEFSCAKFESGPKN